MSELGFELDQPLLSTVALTKVLLVVQQYAWFQVCLCSGTDILNSICVHMVVGVLFCEMHSSLK